MIAEYVIINVKMPQYHGQWTWVMRRLGDYLITS